MRGCLSGFERSSPRLHHPSPDDLDRLAASFHHLALCCRKLAPDKARQHPTAEAMAEDEQFLVGAVPAAGEQSSARRCSALRLIAAFRRAVTALDPIRLRWPPWGSARWPVDGRLKKFRPGLRSRR